MYAFTYAHVMFLRMFVAITSTHERDPDILKLCLRAKLKYLVQGFRKFEHEHVRHTNRRDRSHHLPYSLVVIKVKCCHAGHSIYAQCYTGPDAKITKNEPISFAFFTHCSVIFCLKNYQQTLSK